MKFDELVRQLTEEYTYMYDEISFPPIKNIKPNIKRGDFNIDANMEDVKKAMLLYFEAEYKHSKLFLAGKQPPEYLDRLMNKLFNYFVSLWTALMKNVKVAMEYGAKSINPEDAWMKDEDSWLGDTFPDTINKLIKAGKAGGFSEKVIAINAIISTTHTEEILLGKFIKDGSMDYENGVWDVLDDMSDKTKNRRYTYRWDKELDQEFGI